MSRIRGFIAPSSTAIQAILFTISRPPTQAEPDPVLSLRRSLLVSDLRMRNLRPRQRPRRRRSEGGVTWAARASRFLFIAARHRKGALARSSLGRMGDGAWPNFAPPRVGLSRIIEGSTWAEKVARAANRPANPMPCDIDASPCATTTKRAFWPANVTKALFRSVTWACDNSVGHRCREGSSTRPAGGDTLWGSPSGAAGRRGRPASRTPGGLAEQTNHVRDHR